jgi:hypothetical protein
MTQLPWIIALAAIGLLLIGAAFWARGGGSSRRSSKAPLPSDWALTPRPVLSGDERRIFRQLIEALPDHVVFAKLPLVRFCYPADPTRVRYWFDLLGGIHVAFAVSTVSGRVVAAIDVERERDGSRRSLQIKQAVLNACRIRYLRIAPDAMPSAAELQMLVPPTGPRPARTLHEARDTLATTVASRRAERSAWQDSTQYTDSFFAPDTRLDGFGGSEFGALAPQGSSSRFDQAASDNEVVGVVVDPPSRTGGTP